MRPGAKLPGLRIEALPTNTAALTYLANYTGYKNIYTHQLEVKGSKGDLLIVLSGRGDSSNIARALETANRMGMNTFAILAFCGGRCKKLANTTIHFEIDDM